MARPSEVREVPSPAVQGVPDPVKDGGRYRSALMVFAVELTRETAVETEDKGREIAQPGDMLVQLGPGRLRVMKPAVFRRQFSLDVPPSEEDRSDQMRRFQEQFEDRYFPHWRSWGLIYFSNALAAEVGKLCALVRGYEFRGGTKETDPQPNELLAQAVDAEIVLCNLRMGMGFSEREWWDAVFAKQRVNADRMAIRQA